MHYFISTQEDYNTSAIELAQVKRMQIFDALDVPCKIVELQKNDFIQECRNKLKTSGRVINIFQYFQQLPDTQQVNTEKALDQIFNQPGLIRKENNAYLNERAVIQAHLYGSRIYYVDHLDQYGFTVKREFYRYNHLDYTEFFDDKAQLKMREFVDQNNNPLIREYFCQSNQNKPMLTLIEIKKGFKTVRFEKEASFRAYFLDCLAERNAQAVFYCDRCTQVLPAFEKMKHIVPSYVIFHSALTPSGYLNDQVYSVFKPVTELAKAGKIRGLISSTKREAKDAAEVLQVSHSYGIPVTFTTSEDKIPFSSRTPGKIIAVARIDVIKQLSHLIQAVIDLHIKYPQIALSIYGNNTDEAENKRLTTLVSENHAASYINFCGFAQNLDQVYNSAQLEVLTSKNEGFAMALLEAKAHGCPAVSYNINYGPAEIIEDGISGKLVPMNNQAVLKKTIEALLTNPNLMTQYSACAYQSAKRFDFSHLKAKWFNFLKEEGLC